MYNPEHVYVAPKRMSFLTATALGLSMIASVALVCGSGITIYGIRVIDKKTDSVAGLGRTLLEDLPRFRELLPPALSDAIDDVRRPDYTSQLKVSARVTTNTRWADRVRPVVEVQNLGDEVVSLLAVRVVLLDEGDVPVAEWTEYVATPIAVPEEWRGPIQPGETRRVLLSLSRVPLEGRFEVTTEIGDLRVWTPAGADRSAQTRQPSRNTSTGRVAA
jgi:hypothetical protein